MRRFVWPALVMLAGAGALRALAQDDFNRLKAEYDRAQQEWIQKLQEARGPDGNIDPTKAPPDPAEKFVPRFRAYAEKHAGKPEALPALAWIVCNGGPVSAPGEEEGPAQWAAEQLTRDHAGDPAIGEYLRDMRYAAYSAGAKPLIKLYEKVLETNKDKNARAWATFNLACTIYEEAGPAGSEGNRPDTKRVLELFRTAVRDFPGTEVAERAADYIYELENLQIGMKAPEIVGDDVDGQSIKLSQLRGQVVALDFWGFW